MTDKTRTFLTPQPSEPSPDSLRETSAILPVWPARNIFPGPGSVIAAAGTYRLVGPLGSGGFGSVQLAEVVTPPGPGVPRQVAVKFFHSGSIQRARENASREFSALLSLKSPHIPKLYDGNLETQHPFFVFEYFPGGNLSSIFAGSQPLDEEGALRVLEQVLSALVTAHGSSLLHLDIKPQNILLDGNGGVALADFGLTQAVRARARQGASPGLGTVGYRAPELVQCAFQEEERGDPFERLDVRTDLWAVGATLWAVHSGINLSRPPAELPPGPDGCSLPSLLDVRPEASPLIQELVAPLLQEDPRDRPGSAAEVLAEARARRKGEPSLARAFGPASPRRLSPPLAAQLLASLADPLWRSLCDQFGERLRVLRFHKGEVLCCEGAYVHHTFVLLRGVVLVTLHGRVVATERFEGTFIGEVSTLSGLPRTASCEALEETFVVAFNAAELEEFLSRHPAVCLRLLKLMARRQFEDRTRGPEAPL